MEKNDLLYPHPITRDAFAEPNDRERRLRIYHITMSSIVVETVMTVIQPYADKLVQITAHHIVFHWYYFPFGSKEVLVSEIECITALQPSLATGSWRIWGTGDFFTWFPCDWRRPKRDVIFHLKLKEKSRYIGFTVEDSWAVMSLFREMGLLRSDLPSAANALTL